MDFFEHQDNARKKTGRLVLLFVIGLAVTIILINLLFFAVYGGGYDIAAFKRWWGSNLNWQISVGVLFVISLGTLVRYFELAGGGRKVAEWAGAKPLNLQRPNEQEKLLINVAEEMAIAAGMPVPELYVMDKEDGINAFVAGFKVEEAVLVVTKGTLDKLSRDQLQGVIGHEYSHILNGDMRLNIRLMASLGGLILLGQVGGWLVGSSFHSRRHRHRSSRGNDKAALVMVVLGIGLVFAGYVGVLVGRIIKAAVSRQREYLADASSVQFTRNPDGLAGALYEINELAAGSRLHHAHAEDMSHLCFGESVALSQRLATHPPLAERIRRISPKFMATERSKRRRTESASSSVTRSAPQAFDQSMALVGMSAMVGQITPSHLEYAQSLYKHIPEQMKDWVHQSAGAKSYIYCQILLGNDTTRQDLLNLIKKEDPGSIEILQRVWAFSKKMDKQLRLPLLEMSVATLKQMPDEKLEQFLTLLNQLVMMDGRIDFSEWVTITLVNLRLKPKVSKRSGKLNQKITSVTPALNVLFSFVVGLSADQPKAESMKKQISQRMSLPYEPNTSLGQANFSELRKAMLSLDSISFMWRKTILEACGDIINADGRIEYAEYEALRVVAECLECPMPPMINESFAS